MTLSDGRTVPAWTLDISKSGAGVVSDLNMPVGSVVTLRMNIPARPSGSALFEAKATVANCTLAARNSGFRLGLEFRPLSDDALTALQGILP